MKKWNQKGITSLKIKTRNFDTQLARNRFDAQLEIFLKSSGAGQFFNTIKMFSSISYAIVEFAPLLVLTASQV